MPIEVLGATEVFGQIKEEIKTDTKRKLEQFGELASTEIIKRTEGGHDVDGRQFKAYSDKYKKYKSDVGRNPDRVDLTLTGNMLQAIRSRVKTLGDSFLLEIFFNNTSSRAPKSNTAVSAIEKARANNAKRRFFALSDEQLEKLRTTLIGK